MQIHFYGAAKTVTGSCHMLETANGNVLIDCGMRQGADAEGDYGNDSFPFSPSSVSAMLVTHAHIDHTGLIPLLVKRGFTGNVLCTDATAQLSTIMLPDSAHIQEQEAEWLSRKNERAGKPPVEPLYTVQDAQTALKQFHSAKYGEVIQLLPGVRVRFLDVGHLLGSAAIEIWVEENNTTTKIVFSGDVGRGDRPIICDPTPVQEADYLVLESTYGDRDHAVTENKDKVEELAQAIRLAMKKGGNLVIPSFAVGRTQEILYYIKTMLINNTVPGLESVPVYIDSPLGIEATKIYERCAEGYYDEEAKKLAASGSPFDFPTLRVAQTVDESKAINDLKGAKIIISSSGMCDAGRIRHHLKHNLYQPESVILFSGYQAVGTLGRNLIDGAKKVKLFGETIQVNATVMQVEGFSGHAGQSELIDWLKNIAPKPKRVFLVHGEVESIEALGDRLTRLGYSIMAPEMGDSYDFAADGKAAKAKKPVRKLFQRPEATIQIPPPVQPSVIKPQKERRKASAPIPDGAAVVDIKEKARGFGIIEALDQIEAIVDRSQERRSPDMELKISIMEADIKALAEKWDKIIG